MPKDARLDTQDEFENMCTLYLNLQEQVTGIEKNIKSLLDNEVGNIKFGSDFGAYNTYTISNSLSYAELYKLAKQLILQNKPSGEILNLLNEKEKEMKADHKSSAKSFKVFLISDRETIINKLYKD